MTLNASVKKNSQPLLEQIFSFFKPHVGIAYLFFFRKVALYKKEVLWGTLLLVLTNAIGVFIPFKIKEVVDFFVKNGLKSTGDIWLTLAMIGGLALLMSVIRTGSRVVLFGVGRRIESDLKQEFYEHVLKLDMMYFSSQRIGDLISRSTNDIMAIRQMMGFGLLNVINIVWVYALTLPVMISLNAQLTFWVLLGYVPILFFVRHISLKLKVQQQKAQEDLGRLSSFIEEDLNGVQVIKAYSQEEREIKRFEEINDEYLKVSTELAQWRGIIWPIMELARGISFFVLLFYTSKGLLSAGTVAAFLIYLERLLFPTAIIGWLITIFQRGSVSIQRVEDILIEKTKILNLSSNELKANAGQIEIKGLTFEYDSKPPAKGVKATNENTKLPALNDLSLTIEAGQFLGIVGLIGSGKSTLCESLLRLINIPENKIFIDGQDIVQSSIQSLRQKVSLVPQETFLFNTSVAENIGFAGNFSTQEIETAAQIAQIHAEIIEFPAGYETLVGEKGVSLSGGQAQRIALARAIIARPQILLLDDSIASVDNEVGLKILQAVRERFKGQTLILVTHRISSLKDADQIYVMDHGACVGQGKHSTLLRTNPIYQKLWKKQKLASTL